MVLFTLCITVFLQQANKPAKVTESRIIADLELVPCDSEVRFEAVKHLFFSKGVAEQDMSVETFEKGENLVVTKKGNSNEIVVVGAHYDKVDSGCGAVDNWTGLVILANLYGTMKDLSTEKTYKFVAFDSEEKGLVGSGAMAKAIPESSRNSYCAMVNVDSFGFTFPQVLDNASTDKMRDAAKVVAKEMDNSLSEASLLGVVDADSSSFKNNKIPAITFHGLSSDWRNYLHTSKDQLENINPSSVYVGYEFVLRFLKNIESSGCGSFR